jgi:hypothetical protein
MSAYSSSYLDITYNFLSSYAVILEKRWRGEKRREERKIWRREREREENGCEENRGGVGWREEGEEGW